MNNRCKECGQVLPRQEPHPLSEAELLAALRDETKHREVYKSRDGEWCVTYGGGVTSDSAVQSLRMRGLINPVYSSLPNDAFHIGQTIDCEATLAARKRYGNRHPLLYVSSAPSQVAG